MRTFIKFWRRFGALFVLISQLIVGSLGYNHLFGWIGLLWLTVPCGISWINKNIFIWYLRQLLFLFLALASILR